MDHHEENGQIKIASKEKMVEDWLSWVLSKTQIKGIMDAIKLEINILNNTLAWTNNLLNMLTVVYIVIQMNIIKGYNSK